MTSLFTLILLTLVSNGIFAKPTGNDKKHIPTDTRGASDIIEEANANSNMTDIVNGDIMVNSQMMNADPCTAIGCLWPKDDNGFVTIQHDIRIPRKAFATRRAIQEALDTFHDLTCIRFVKAKGKKGDRLSFKQLSGCYSYVGRQGGSQDISIGLGCGYLQVIQHELLHALGLHHEQNRSDRDDYVEIIYENILTGYEHNFDKVDTNNLDTDYDYNSVMQYGSYAFSKDYGVLPTIVAIMPTEELGGATEMSDTDFLRVNLLYGCTDYLPV